MYSVDIPLIKGGRNEYVFLLYQLYMRPNRILFFAKIQKENTNHKPFLL